MHATTQKIPNIVEPIIIILHDMCVGLPSCKKRWYIVPYMVYLQLKSKKILPHPICCIPLNQPG